MESARRIIVALDVETADEARSVVRELKDEVGAFKVGLQLFTVAGPEFVREIAADHRIFLDLKFHDIPHTVAKAGIEAARLGVWMFNMHAMGGSEMMQTAVNEVGEVCDKEGFDRPLIIGVTILTSSDANTLRQIGIETGIATQVSRLAQLAKGSGLDGVVASPMEVAAIRATTGGSEFLVVTPGVRPEFATVDDQKRVMAPREALLEGADYLVIGRPILNAPDRSLALRRIYEEIDTAR
ncbi:MAG TPA: orotidine-5'-phosphate decarboxylase [Pyrinomonadaceae bacterium]